MPFDRPTDETPPTSIEKQNAIPPAGLIGRARNLAAKAPPTQKAQVPVPVNFMKKR